MKYMAAPSKKSLQDNNQLKTLIIQAVVLVVVAISAYQIGALKTEITYLRGGNLPTPTPTAAQPTQPTGALSRDQVVAQLTSIADSLSVDTGDFQTCLNEGRYTQKVRDQLASGDAAGVRGTPGNFVYNMRTGEAASLAGAVPFETVSQTVQDVRSGTISAQPNLVDGPSDSDHVRGDRNADIAIIEYSDLECPFCARFHNTANQAVEELNVMWVYRHFPLTGHQFAQLKAEASECIAEYGGEDAFWAYTDAIFAQL